LVAEVCEGGQVLCMVALEAPVNLASVRAQVRRLCGEQFALEPWKDVPQDGWALTAASEPGDSVAEVVQDSGRLRG